MSEPEDNPPVVPVRLIFLDSKGRLVRDDERYSKKVKYVEAYRRGRYVRIIEDGGVTPEKLVDLVTREEFESLPETYGNAIIRGTRARKYKAWDLAGKVVKERGMRGKSLRLTFRFKDGKRIKKLTLFFQPKKYSTNAQNQTALWSAITRTLGVENKAEYDKVRSRFLEDRKGTTKITLQDVTIEKVL